MRGRVERTNATLQEEELTNNARKVMKVGGKSNVQPAWSCLDHDEEVRGSVLWKMRISETKQKLKLGLSFLI